LLRAEGKRTAVAVFRSGASLNAGDAVTLFGYPLPDLLSSAGNVSTGIVSATSGLGNDIRYIQISAPVQPGNSGGPLFDKSGHVVGVVVAQLDALKTAKLTGDIPQNVNFAVHWSEVRAFLDEEGISYRKEPSTNSLSTRQIAAAAAQITVAIDCTQ
jgi:S1-C subfamily serine protease